MSFNGSGTFLINSSGQPVVTGTTISSTVFNALTADLATGLTNVICKDGQSTTTGTIPFATAVTMASTLGVTGATTLSSTLAVTGVATFTAQPILSSLTASQAVFSDGSKGLVSNAITGSGSVAMSTSPTFATSVIGSASMDVFNTTSTTVNAFGAATTATLGATTGTMTLRNATVAVTNALTVGTTLGVTGTSTLAAINASGTISSSGNIQSTTGIIYSDTFSAYSGTNLSVIYGGAGTLTFSNGSSRLSISSAGAVTIPGTLGVTGAITASNLTASRSVLTDASKNLISADAPVTNSLAADVTLNNIANYFDGPSAANGTSGTWFASGTVTLTATAATSVYLKLWDGATVIASCSVAVGTGSSTTCATLSGYLTTPAGNLRISARDAARTDTKIVFNFTGNSKDSTISAVRVA